MGWVQDRKDERSVRDIGAFGSDGCVYGRQGPDQWSDQGGAVYSFYGFSIAMAEIQMIPRVEDFC